MRWSRIAACATAVWLAAEAQASELAMPIATRFSLGEVVIEDRFSLLDPTWLLPPIDSLDAVAAFEQDEILEEQVLHATSDAPPPAPRPAGPVSYSLNERLSAQVRYRHAYLFGTGTSAALRGEGPRSFSSRPDRDVLGLNMSWRLAGSTVGLGYQLESAREREGADAGVTRFLPGSEQATHSLTLGLTREWGRRDRPPVIEAPIAAEAIAAPTAPTPAAATGDQPAP